MKENEIVKVDNVDIILTPSEFFDKMKIDVDVLNDLDLKKQYNVSYKLLEKAIKTNQIRQIKKLQFLISTIKREEVIRKFGIDKYILSSDMHDYIQKVDKRVVKVTDLEEYPREIPEKVVQTILDCENLFDKLLIVFTDYTDEVGQQIEQDKRDKDPILFGVFYDELDTKIHERMYFLADWEDEYCDLTLSQLIKEYKEIDNKSIVKDMLKETEKEIDLIAKNLVIDSNKKIKSEKKSFIERLKYLFTGIFNE